MNLDIKYNLLLESTHSSDDTMVSAEIPSEENQLGNIEYIVSNTYICKVTITIMPS